MDVPQYRDLPLAEGGARSAWHLFGEGDSLGMMNLVTPEKVLEAMQLVRKGVLFPLNMDYDYLQPSFFHRSNARRSIFQLRPGQTIDDVHDNYYPQSGTQWDSLAHQAFKPGVFYNGVTTDQILNGKANTIEHLAQKGIATRGVLLDVSELVAAAGGPGESVPISPDDLEQARQHWNLKSSRYRESKF